MTRTVAMITIRPAKVPAIIGTGEFECESKSGSLGALVYTDGVEDDVNITELVRRGDDFVLARMGSDVGFNDELQTGRERN